MDQRERERRAQGERRIEHGTRGRGWCSGIWGVRQLVVYVGKGLLTEKGTSLTRSLESSRIGHTKLKLCTLVSAMVMLLLWLLSSSSHILLRGRLNVCLSPWLYLKHTPTQYYFMIQHWVMSFMTSIPTPSRVWGSRYIKPCVYSLLASRIHTHTNPISNW